MRVLYIEDDDASSKLVEVGLKPYLFAVDRVATVADALGALSAVRYDVIILDLNLPDGDGISLLKGLRAQRDTTPVLILSARSRTDERITGLYAGADDYLPKPFDLFELAARLHALTRRPSTLLDARLSCGNLVFEPTTHTVFVDDHSIHLPRREAAVLEQLLRNVGRPVAKSVIEDQLYAFGEEIASNSVEVHIHHLRKRLANASAHVCIQTKRGTGYLLMPDRPR